MRKIITFINKIRLAWYDFVLAYYMDNFRWAKEIEDDERCEYWDKRYVKVLAKREKIEKYY